MAARLKVLKVHNFKMHNHTTIQYRLAKGTATAPYDTEYNADEYNMLTDTANSEPTELTQHTAHIRLS
jgi:hypothetical protein